jgi:outer membrane protein OmpA-like peptidoglycan-associated protein
MRMTSLSSTTAILVGITLLQPLPSLAQSRPATGLKDADKQTPGRGQDRQGDPRPAAVICAQAGITDDQACRLLIEALGAAAGGEDPAERRDGSATGQPADPGAQGRDRAVEAGAEAEVRAAIEAEIRAAAAAEEAARQAERQAAEEAAAAEAEAQAAIEADIRAAAAAEEAAAAEAEARGATEAEIRAAAAIEEAARLAERQAAEEGAAAALAVEAGLATLAEAAAGLAEPAEVTSEVVTERTRRSSSEEFRDWRRPQDVTGPAPAATVEARSGMSDLERAGLFALGAVVVGAILSNGQRVEAQTGDRVVLVDDVGLYTVLKDDDALLRTPGADVRTERFTDGSTRTVVVRDDGTTIITVRDVHGRALRRVRVEPDGREYLLIDDTRTFAPVIVQDLPPPIQTTFDYEAGADPDALRVALLAADRRDLGRSFSLRQVREILQVRELAPEINLDGITFETNSAAIQPAQAQSLREMGLLMHELIRDNPGELFLVEGHTDAVGEAGYNLLLSDRRAESVALAFSEYFGVGPENIIVQGYGESFLKIPTQSAERLNRRVAVRRITALLRTL